MSARDERWENVTAWITHPPGYNFEDDNVSWKAEDYLEFNIEVVHEDHIYYDRQLVAIAMMEDAYIDIYKLVLDEMVKVIDDHLGR
jgi:hypothetical protein